MLPLRRAPILPMARASALAAMLVAWLGLPVRNAKLAEDPRTVELEAIFAPWSDSQSPGVAGLVRKDGRAVFERGYGVRDLKTFASIDPHTNFRLASCTKQFTAMAVMLLVRDGQLRYGQTLTDIFPDFPAYGYNITIG